MATPGDGQTRSNQSHSKSPEVGVEISLRHRTETHRLVKNGLRHPRAVISYRNVWLVVALLDTNLDVLGFGVNGVVDEISYCLVVTIAEVAKRFHKTTRIRIVLTIILHHKILLVDALSTNWIFRFVICYQP